jgi:hypothetical protein
VIPLRLFDQPVAWLEDVRNRPDARLVLTWITERLCNENDNTPGDPILDAKGRPSTASRVPGTAIEVVWKMDAGGRIAVVLIGLLPPFA